MNAKTLRALKESIFHWKNNETVSYEQAEIGPEYCALCRMFLGDGNACRGCPVFEYTGETGCHGTPYDDIEMIDDTHDAEDRWPILATREREFLESLLPADVEEDDE
jgi:hypothetical protein